MDIDYQTAAVYGICIAAVALPVVSWMVYKSRDTIFRLRERADNLRKESENLENLAKNR